MLEVALLTLCFATGYVARATCSNLIRVANPSPYPSADTHYYLVADSAGNLALTDEQVEAARDRAERLGL